MTVIKNWSTSSQPKTSTIAEVSPEFLTKYTGLGMLVSMIDFHVPMRTLNQYYQQMI